MTDNVSKETKKIAKTLEDEIIHLTEVNARQFEAIQEQFKQIQFSLTLLQRQIDLLNERVAVTDDKFGQHIAGHK